MPSRVCCAGARPEMVGASESGTGPVTEPRCLSHSYADSRLSSLLRPEQSWRWWCRAAAKATKRLDTSTSRLALTLSEDTSPSAAAPSAWRAAALRGACARSSASPTWLRTTLETLMPRVTASCCHPRAPTTRSVSACSRLLQVGAPRLPRRLSSGSGSAASAIMTTRATLPPRTPITPFPQESRSAGGLRAAQRPLGRAPTDPLGPLLLCGGRVGARSSHEQRWRGSAGAFFRVNEEGVHEDGGLNSTFQKPPASGNS